jgi:hypothetical protein
MSDVVLVVRQVGLAIGAVTVVLLAWRCWLSQPKPYNVRALVVMGTLLLMTLAASAHAGFTTYWVVRPFMCPVAYGGCGFFERILNWLASLVGTAAALPLAIASEGRIRVLALMAAGIMGMLFWFAGGLKG